MRCEVKTESEIMPPRTNEMIFDLPLSAHFIKFDDSPVHDRLRETLVPAMLGLNSVHFGRAAP
jgi:hypothetical protein